jgi:hypothetical protein
MAKRQQNDPATRAGERRGEKSKPPTGGDAARKRSGERDSGRSWVQDEPQLDQGDEPQRSGYSDRETPEAEKSGPRSGEPAERRPKR